MRSWSTISIFSPNESDFPALLMDVNDASHYPDAQYNLFNTKEHHLPLISLIYGDEGSMHIMTSSTQVDALEVPKQTSTRRHVVDVWATIR